MKIAIASDDNKTITGHIGRVRGFVVLEIESGEIKSREYRPNTFTNHAQGNHKHNHGEHSHGHGHESLAEGLKECSHLVCTGAGWRVVEDLKKCGIEVFFTKEIEADAAAQKLEKGELEINEEGACHAH